MYGKRLYLIVLTAVIYFLGAADGYGRENFNDDSNLVSYNYVGSPFGRLLNNAKLSEIERSNKRSPGFTPYISVGALSNMHQFFQNLKDNFHSLENLSDDQARALLGNYRQLGECDFTNRKSSSASTHPRARKHSYNQGLRIFRPPATAAYIHATRSRRPSSPIRKFVSSSEPVHLRGSNKYNPSYLWTGLGRKR